MTADDRNVIAPRLVGIALALTLLFNCTGTRSQPIPIIYGANIQAERDDSRGPNDTLVTVGAQVNSINAAGVNQIAFGIATEAWAKQGSFSRLIGIEASTINLEPGNDMRKIGAWLTFKNRSDVDYRQRPPFASNTNSQALRIESEPGTGWGRGIVFARESLFESKDTFRPVAIDYSEVPMRDFAGWVLERFPDGWCSYYAGQGVKVARRCE